MFELLKTISETNSLQSGLHDFFKQFETREEALAYWANHFEKSECLESKELVKEVFLWRF